MKFAVTLCHDVLFNVLQHGRRRQLSMLEPIGRRFRRVINEEFVEAPLLFLDIELWPYGIFVRGNNSNGYFAIGLNPTLTPFLRFDNVKLGINFFLLGSKSIRGAISLLGNAFNAFKASKLIVEAVIDQNVSLSFPNYTEMLDYIANQVFPTSIFHSSQSCKFVVNFFNDSETAKDFVSSLLQLPAIAHKSNILIELKLFELNPQQQIQLLFRTFPMPTEGIAKWLHHSEGTGKARVLYIDLGYKIENRREIFNHLIEQFEAARIPTRPFILELKCGGYGYYGFGLFDNAETFYNQHTKEELSIQQNGLRVTIKRAKKETK